MSICLGSPPETLVYEYYDKDKVYHKLGPLTPLEFYQQYVKPYFNVDDKVSLTYLLSRSCYLLTCVVRRANDNVV